MKKIFVSGLALLFFSFSLFALDSSIANNEKVEKVEGISSVKNTKGIKIYVVGDSTLSSFNDSYYYPRYGYGTRIQDYILPEKAEVVNLAMSGRSSKSFLTEVNYQTLKDNIKKGDYLIIGFGHNDEKAEEARYTNPNGSKEESGSFKNCLYENYIKLAKSRKATPILCTPIVRRTPNAEKAYEGAYVHITDDVEGFPGGDYPKAIRELGKGTKTLVVDLTKITLERYSKSSVEETAKFHAQLTHRPTSVDNTHLNYYGAAVIAKDFVDSAAKGNKKFAKLLIKEAVVPSESLLEQKARNPAYIIPEYSAFDASKASEIFKTTAPWYGTVFGDCGGAEKIANPELFEINEDNGKVVIHSGSKDGKKSAGKISSSSDGIAFYFQQVDISKDFTLTADAKILNFAKNNQVAFGLMVRDDVHIDKYDNTINSDYIAVGGYRMASTPVISSYSRIDTAIATVPAVSEKIVKDAVISLSISKKGNVYTVKCGNDPAVNYTAGLDFVDNKNIYAGLFTARAAYIEFSNVKLTVE